MSHCLDQLNGGCTRGPSRSIADNHIEVSVWTEYRFTKSTNWNGDFDAELLFELLKRCVLKCLTCAEKPAAGSN